MIIFECDNCKAQITHSNGPLDLPFEWEWIQIKEPGVGGQDLICQDCVKPALALAERARSKAGQV